MKPKSAYDDISSRARDLLTLHDGLINIRKRGIRSDWKASFCKIMHWPQDTDIERVDTVDALVVLRQGSTLQPAHFSADTLDDLLRASLVLGVSALDRYIHERVIKRIVPSLRKARLTTRQQQFAVPASLAVRLSSIFARARTRGKQARPANEVRKKIQEILHARPFQSWADLDYAFELLGITDFEGQVQAAYHLPNTRKTKNQLNGIVRKRNQIVHEGDLVRHQRGGKTRRLEVSRKYVDESLAFLDGFVEVLEGVS